MKKDNRYKFYCTNCGASQNRKKVEGMLDADWQLKHLECWECGRQDLAVNPRFED